MHKSDDPQLKAIKNEMENSDARTKSDFCSISSSAVGSSVRASN